MVVSVSSQQPILIAGAGPAGLALAQGLRKRDIPFRIFDRDIDERSRGQGWAVALQWIIPELRASLPADVAPLETASHLHNLGLTCELAMFDGLDGRELLRTQEGEEFFRADRKQLRDLLRTNVDVEWDHRITRFEEGAEGVRAFFADGSTANGSMLVGGDGFKSPVRSQLLPDARLAELPIETVFGTLTLSRAESEAIFAQLARSVTIARTEDVFLFIGLHHFSDDGQTAYWYWTALRSAHDKRPVDQWTSEERYAEAMRWVAPFDAKFKTLLERTKPSDTIVLPEFLITWSPPAEGFSSSRVTLIGDAAHKITPLGGTGVNHAIQDTLEFCKALDQYDSIPDAIAAYDREVAKRGREAVEKASGW